MLRRNTMKQTGSIIGFTLLLTALTPAVFAADRTYSGDYNGNFSGSGSGYCCGVELSST